jgi:hypothetical protein
MSSAPLRQATKTNLKKQSYFVHVLLYFILYFWGIYF